MANTSDIKNGLCLNYNHDIFKIVEFLHVKPGKGPAFVRTKLKSLTTGKVIDNTFPAGHKIDVVRVERRTYQFLYKDGDDFNFMNTETYEQIAIEGKKIDNGDLLKDGENVEILFHAEKELPLTIDLPQYITLEVTYTEPGVKEFLHVKPGKGPAFVRTKLKSLTTGKVIDNTFPAGHKIDVVRVERRTYQFLYKDGDDFNFMNTETYEQIAIEGKKIDNGDLLKDGENVEILFHAEKELPLTIDLPQYITLEVTYTEPGVKGNTATNVTKPATVTTGAQIKVPIFINEGDLIKIDSKTRAYVERVKK